MSDLTTPLGTSLHEANVPIGRKGAALNELMLAGFPVPPGLCITTEAFRIAIEPYAERIRTLCSSRDLRDPVVAHDTAPSIATMLHGLELPPQLLQELSHELPALGSTVLAVRSSATLEDLGSTSFAGQYHTALGVVGEQALADAVLTCWRSFFSANALAAQARLGLHLALADGGMAVLIQPLIQAECSGVCFTVDPVHPRGEVMLVTSAWGWAVAWWMGLCQRIFIAFGVWI